LQLNTENFGSKKVIPEINTISSAAITKRAKGERWISTDRKNRPFLGRFGRKNDVLGNENRVYF
jgi:hypothetical protein